MVDTAEASVGVVPAPPVAPENTQNSAHVLAEAQEVLDNSLNPVQLAAKKRKESTLPARTATDAAAKEYKRILTEYPEEQLQSWAGDNVTFRKMLYNKEASEIDAAADRQIQELLANDERAMTAGTYSTENFPLEDPEMKIALVKLGAIQAKLDKYKTLQEQSIGKPEGISETRLARNVAEKKRELYEDYVQAETSRGHSDFIAKLATENKDIEDAVKRLEGKKTRKAEREATKAQQSAETSTSSSQTESQASVTPASDEIPAGTFHADTSYDNSVKPTGKPWGMPSEQVRAEASAAVGTATPATAEPVAAIEESGMPELTPEEQESKRRQEDLDRATAKVLENAMNKPFQKIELAYDGSPTRNTGNLGPKTFEEPYELKKQREEMAARNNAPRSDGNPNIRKEVGKENFEEAFNRALNEITTTEEYNQDNDGPLADTVKVAGARRQPTAEDIAQAKAEALSGLTPEEIERGKLKIDAVQAAKDKEEAIDSIAARAQEKRDAQSMPSGRTNEYFAAIGDKAQERVEGNQSIADRPIPEKPVADTSFADDGPEGLTDEQRAIWKAQNHKSNDVRQDAVIQTVANAATPISARRMDGASEFAVPMSDPNAPTPVDKPAAAPSEDDKLTDEQRAMREAYNSDAKDSVVPLSSDTTVAQRLSGDRDFAATGNDGLTDISEKPVTQVNATIPVTPAVDTDAGMSDDRRELRDAMQNNLPDAGPRMSDPLIRASRLTGDKRDAVGASTETPDAMTSTMNVRPELPEKPPVSVAGTDDVWDKIGRDALDRVPNDETKRALLTKLVGEFKRKEQALGNSARDKTMRGGGRIAGAMLLSAAMGLGAVGTASQERHTPTPVDPNPKIELAGQQLPPDVNQLVAVAGQEAEKRATEEEVTADKAVSEAQRETGGGIFGFVKKAVESLTS